ncbi:Uu.00g044740.m01.CDS01 [Anthostomella pinea]|uniref:Uu.00g044740.m01.CDS01 n=1 Tax=Anthostomella pinea TaxID=933095 RepID=A0AAI8VB20_9PEZI|nr:Uu.00g044740.m01.CDS01 [Anthostomella pinea]
MCPPISGAAAAASAPSSSNRAGTDERALEHIPNDDLSRNVYSYAANNLHPLILAHSLRVYLFAKALAEREHSDWATPDRLPLLFTACICHDMGTCASHDGPQRFEVEGGDAAVSLLTHHGGNVSEQDKHEVWVAIALHTSRGIAERISLLARLVRLAVGMDFKLSAAMPLTTAEEVQRFEGLFPRGEIEKVLGDAVTDQVLGKPDDEGRGVKAPGASWPGDLVRGKAENPDWEGVNKAF